MLRDNVGRLAELHRRLEFPFCGDDFRATLALGLGFFCHCTLHIVGQYNVFNLDRRYLGATLAITQCLYEGARIRLDPDRQEMSRHWDSRTQSILLYPERPARSAVVPHRTARAPKLGYYRQAYRTCVRLRKGGALGEGSVNLFRASITIAALLALCPQCRADPAPIVHYTSAENLEHVDVALLDTAWQEIDLAAYVLTDWPIIKALTRAADRGVKVRIYLDGTQLAGREPTKPFHDLADTPGVEIRTKHKPGAPMHLKSYQIDGRVLRTGAANFLASGLKRQDNDLVVVESAEAAEAFKRIFDARFASDETLLVSVNQ